MPFPHSISHPSGSKLTLVPDKVLVKVASSPTARSTDPLGALGLVPLREETARRGGPTASAGGDDLPHGSINDSETLVFTRTADGTEFEPKQEAIASGGGADWVAPVYAAEFAGGTEYLSPQADEVVLPSAVLEPDRAEILEAYGLIHDEARSEWLGDFEIFTVAPGHKPAYEIRDELAEKLGTEVRLEFIPMVTPVAMNPNDPLFSSQWDMVRIGAGGDGTTGWDLQRGSSQVTIAILDEGVDLNHPDLVGTFLNNGINLGSMSGTGAPTGNHGTPCAGIAAAPVNNGVGTAGVAGGCRILPIAFANWTDTEVAAGIRYARQQGARVISMSFGWNGWDRAIIDPAIAEAHAAGMVLVAATHNHDTANGITYPATHPLVMAVGASDQADNRKSPASPDGEPWGSNFGPQMSVVAPGVLCPAPDRRGNQGYSTGDYTPNFNGTSAATPHVAGLAGLLLSRRGSLTNVEVRRIIETTAAKVGTLAYQARSDRPNGTWNNQMGYGRIDVVAALNAVPGLWWKQQVPEVIEVEKLRILEVEKLRIPEVKRWVDEVIKREPEIVVPKRVGEFDFPWERLQDPVINPDRELLVQVEQRLGRLENAIERIGASFIDHDSRPEV